ncbi:hypothetical protein L6Q79_02040 [bacterium]|nr:hypothetical protein [bacterium]NUN45025.1 hypothetical protein [bacterium]
MEIRELTVDDIAQAARISVESFDDYNIVMSKMGEIYLRTVFFPAIVQRQDTGAMGAFQDGKMLGYYCYMLDFHRFHADLQNKNFFRNVRFTLSAMMRGRLSIKDLYNVFRAGAWIRRETAHIPVQVGPVAVARDIKGTPTGGMVTFTVVRAVLKKLQQQGIKACWSTVDLRNPSQHVSTAVGFHEKSRIKLWGIEEALHVKEF